MGTSGNMTTSNSHVLYHITIDQGAQSVANNNTNVTVSVYFWRDNTGYTTYGSGTVYCKINGTTYSASVNTSQKITNSGITLFSKNLDIGHNSDGTKTLDTSAWISLDTPLSSSEQSYSQTLTTIPRTSQPSLSASTVTMGNSVTIYTNRASSSFTHNIYYQYGSTGWVTIATGVATSYSWTVPTSFANDTPNSTNLGVTIIQETYASGTYIGYKTVGMTATVPTSYVPTISSVTLSETVSGLAAKFGGYVQGKSKIQGVVSASGVANSTISSYNSTTNSQSFSSSTFTTNEIVNSGSQSVSTTVTDSRGRTSSVKTTNYTALAYANPTITTFTVARANSSGVLDDQGTYVLCTINATISNVNNLNNKSFKIKYKKVSDSTYTTITITPSGTTYTYNSTYLVSGISGDYEYNFVLELTDYFTTVSSTKNIPTAFTLMDFNLSGKGIAFGKVSAMDGFEVEMPAVFGDTVSLDTPLTIDNGGTGATTSSGARTSLEVLKACILYDNDAGNSGTITLSDNANNYTIIDIITWDFYVTRVYNRNNRPVGIMKIGGYGGNYFEWFSESISITNNLITRNSVTYGTISTGGSVQINTTNHLPIRSVIGYKY